MYNGEKNFYIDKNNKWVKDEQRNEEEFERQGNVKLKEDDDDDDK